MWCVCRVRSADGRGNIESRILIKRMPDLRAHGAGFNMSSITRATARKCFKPLVLGELSPRKWIRSTVQVPRHPDYKLKIWNQQKQLALNMGHSTCRLYI